MSRKSLGRSKKGLAGLDEAASLRLARLDQVFNKALDVAVSSVGEAELKECFRTVLAAEGGEKLSNSIQKAVANMLTETQASMIAGYKDVCIQRDLDEKLKALENLPPIDTNSDSSNATYVIEPFEATLLDLKNLEFDNLTSAIHNLESEMKKLSAANSKLRAGIDNEIASLNEEVIKFTQASQSK